MLLKFQSLLQQDIEKTNDDGDNYKMTDQKNYWLVKSEPGTYSWENMKKDRSTCWDGVRNYQARNNMRQMKIGDLSFFYHSIKQKSIVGIVRVIKECYKDHTDSTGRFEMVDFEYAQDIESPVTLEQIKQDPELCDIALIKQSRLSVMQIAHKHWIKILQISRSL